MPSANKLSSRLQEIVGEANLISNPDQLRTYFIDGKRPKAVVSPGTIEETSKIVSFAFENRQAIIPRGNGTKWGIGGIPKKADIVLLTGRLNRITDCDCDNLTLSAEGGITLKEVQERLGKEGRGYFLPLDPPFTERATLGGIVATNSSGPKRFLYGTARDLIIGMKTVFPNGDIVISGGKTVKNVSGYDLCKLLIGSYGTLGIITEITFKLLPLPEGEATLLFFFSTLDDVINFTHDILHSQLLPASLEILNKVAFEKMSFAFPFSTKGDYLVAIGLEGVVEAIQRQTSEISEKGKKYNALVYHSLNSEKHKNFWIGLRNLGQGMGVDEKNLILTKSNFLISKYGEMIRSYEKISQEFGFNVAHSCHCGNGILYTYLSREKSHRSNTDSYVEFIRRLTAEAVRNEGNLIVESAPKPIKRKVHVWGEVRKDFQIMKHIKEEIDPKGVLNPGRFVGGI